MITRVSQKSLDLLLKFLDSPFAREEMKKRGLRVDWEELNSIRAEIPTAA